LKQGKEDLEFNKLRAKFEKPQPKKTAPANSPRGSTEPPRDKGKGKDSKSNPTQDEYTHLCTRWHDEYSDILDGTQDTLPPWREVNHEIHLIDENKWYQYHLPRCPNSLRDEFHAKVNQYVTAGWWEP